MGPKDQLSATEVIIYVLVNFHQTHSNISLVKLKTYEGIYKFKTLGSSQNYR